MILCIKKSLRRTLKRFQLNVLPTNISLAQTTPRMFINIIQNHLLIRSWHIHILINTITNMKTHTADNIHHRIPIGSSDDFLHIILQNLNIIFNHKNLHIKATCLQYHTIAHSHKHTDHP